MKGFVFTPENLIENAHKLGVWSAFGLAETAIFHYHPHVKKIKDPIKLVEEMCKLSGSMTWTDWVVKYHKEVGYKYLNPEVVNEY